MIHLINIYNISGDSLITQWMKDKTYIKRGLIHVSIQSQLICKHIKQINFGSIIVFFSILIQ